MNSSTQASGSAQKLANLQRESEMFDAMSNPVTGVSTVPVAHRHRWKFALLSALFVCGTAMPLHSRAGVVTSTDSFNLSDGFSGAFGASSSVKLSDFQIISLPRFNSSLGTLNQVSITFASDTLSIIFGRASDRSLESDFIPFPPFIINERNDAYFSASMSTSLKLQLFDPSSSSVTRNMPVNSMGCSVSRPDDLTCQDASNIFLDFNGALSIASLGLDAFTGSDPINLLATLDSQFSGNCDVDDVGDTCFINGQVDWIGKVTVTYDYSLLDDGAGGGGAGGGGTGGGGSGTVPEPTSLALVLLALGIGGLSVRRKS